MYHNTVNYVRKKCTKHLRDIHKLVIFCVRSHSTLKPKKAIKCLRRKYDWKVVLHWKDTSKQPSRRCFNIFPTPPGVDCRVGAWNNIPKDKFTEKCVCSPNTFVKYWLNVFIRQFIIWATYTSDFSPDVGRFWWFNAMWSRSVKWTKAIFRYL